MSKNSKEMNGRLFVDIHVLQTVPPSCVNRDDTGSPKTATYGGVNRARVSSQCWKRSMRVAFRDLFNESELGIRSRVIEDAIAEEISELGEPIDNVKLAYTLFKIAMDKQAKNEGKEKDEKKEEEKAKKDTIRFISSAQIKQLADVAIKNKSSLLEIYSREEKSKKNKAGTAVQKDKEDSKKEDEVKKDIKKKATEALLENPSIDIILFGRMLAERPELNNDACAQVAHSISTHRVDNEYDYFTAVDDLQKEGETGSAHIGTVEFNSSTLYRYATVAVHELYKNVNEDVTEVIKKFVKAFVCSMPTGKLNTFANRTLPDAVLITFRQDQPINLVGAFEKPVKSKEGGYVEASAQAFVEHTNKVYSSFASKPKESLVVGELFSGLGKVDDFNKTLEKVGNTTINLISESICK